MCRPPIHLRTPGIGPKQCKRCVVWALGTFFYSYIFFLYNSSIFRFIFIESNPCLFKSHHHTLPHSKCKSEGCFSPSSPTTPLLPPSLQMQDRGFLFTAPMEGAQDMSHNENGPKWRIVWVISMFFLKLFHVILTNYLILGIREVGVRSDNKMGPNNMSGHIVWAISKLFLNFHVLYMLIIFF